MQQMKIYLNAKETSVVLGPVSFNPVKMSTQKTPNCFPNVRHTNIGKGLIVSSYPERRMIEPCVKTSFSHYQQHANRLNVTLITLNDSHIYQKKKKTEKNNNNKKRT